MSQNKTIFPCGHKDPVSLITYSVAGEQKTYSVCKSCETLECFRKFVVSKEPLNSSEESTNC